MTALARPLRLPPLTVGALVWTLVGVAFLLLRVGVVWRAPVGGAELDHLSGAWLASVGIEDARFIPTLFQSVTTFTFTWTESEIPARALALCGTLTIPLALYRLRPVLGEGGALIALLLIALDPAGVILGVTATAAAWDLALALWLLVALVACRPPPWGWLILTFLLATAGPLTLPLVAAATTLASLRKQRPHWRVVAWSAAGVALGVLLTSVQFGHGADRLVLAPLMLFADSFEESWANLNVAALAVLYGLPLLVGGAVAAVWLTASDRLRGRQLTPAEPLLLLTFALSLLWLLVALPAYSPLPLTAATLPASLLLGPALARFADPLLNADWREARYLLPLAFGFAGVVAFTLSLWAPGYQDRDAFEVTLLVCAALGLLVVIARLASVRATRPLAAVPLLVVGVTLLLAGVSGVALSGNGEPLPGRVSPDSARHLRDTALQAAEQRGNGPIAVHASYREALTWPFRNSPDLLLVERVPPVAVVAIWPAYAAVEGFVPLEGRWFLQCSFRAPDSFLDYVHWLGERNSLARGAEAVAIYVREP